MMAAVTTGQAFQQGMREEMARDPRIFVLGTDLYERGGHFAQILGLGREFGPERIRDMPISEAAMVAAGVGAAMNGMRPVVDLNFVDFAFGAMDEIVNQAAKMRYMFGGRARVPLVIRTMIGGRPIDLEVDGGVTAETAPLVARAGANVLVAGSAVFKGGTPGAYRKNIDAIRAAAALARGNAA